VFLSEQHLQTDRNVIGPRSQAFRLATNELLDAARGLRVQFYSESMLTDPDGRLAAVAQIVASRGGTDLFAS
jgi:hypothetical protein